MRSEPRPGASRWAAAFGSGLLFAVGLGVAGMTRPTKVLAFLDVTGAWDPSLALVMAGAIGVYLPAHRWIRRRGRPLLGGSLPSAHNAPVHRRLLVGSALFGLGWGTAGFCPGPAIVSLVTGAPAVTVFVLAMFTGMVLHRVVTVKNVGRAG